MEKIWKKKQKTIAKKMQKKQLQKRCKKQCEKQRKTPSQYLQPLFGLVGVEELKLPGIDGASSPPVKIKPSNLLPINHTQ